MATFLPVADSVNQARSDFCAEMCDRLLVLRYHVWYILCGLFNSDT